MLCSKLVPLDYHDSLGGRGGQWSWEEEMQEVQAKLLLINESIPPPTSDLKKLISSFQNVGLNIRDLVAFAGNFSVINLAWLMHKSTIKVYFLESET